MIGTGERCLPGDADNCGDGGQATKARLSYPKGGKIPRNFVYSSNVSKCVMMCFLHHIVIVTAIN